MFTSIYQGTLYILHSLLLHGVQDIKIKLFATILDVLNTNTGCMYFLMMILLGLKHAGLYFNRNNSENMRIYLVVENINDLLVHGMSNIKLISLSFLVSQFILAFCPTTVNVRKFALISQLAALSAPLLLI